MEWFSPKARMLRGEGRRKGSKEGKKRDTEKAKGWPNGGEKENPTEDGRDSG